MDYEAIDRYMSSWFVCAQKNGTRFFLTDEDLATDRKCCARVVRYLDQALEIAKRENQSPAWQGFKWAPFRVCDPVGETWRARINAARTNESYPRRERQHSRRMESRLAVTYNGSPGGIARAKKLTAKRRHEIAQKAALARWGSPAPKAEKNPSDRTKTQGKGIVP